MRAKRCAPLGPGLEVCGRPATTKRPAPNAITRDVCDYHAEMINRIARQVEKDRPTLDALKRAGD